MKLLCLTIHRASSFIDKRKKTRSHEESVIISVYWNMTPCRLMDEHQSFGGVCCFFHFFNSPRINLDGHKNGKPSFFSYTMVLTWYLYCLPIFWFILNYAPHPLRLIVQSRIDVPTFATRRLHACHHARAPSGGRWNCGRREIFGKFCLNVDFHINLGIFYMP
jgi:hypothetical protein